MEVLIWVVQAWAVLSAVTLFGLSLAVVRGG